MKINFKYGSSVTVLPTIAAERIISGAASQAETAVLIAIAMAPDIETETDEEYTQMLSDVTGLDNEAVNSAIAYWRGAAVISVAGKARTTKHISAPKPAENKAEEELKAEKPTEEANTQAVADLQQPTSKKAIMREELPKYDPETISQICGKDGGALKEVIDQCQQILERIFNPHEVEQIVGLNDHLGLEPEYILMLCAYYSRKKPGCKLYYIVKTAYTLVNDGITTPAALETHIKSMELYDGVAGQLRKLLGIGDRAFTKKENTKISHWINDLGYGIDIINLCYETTVNNIKEFSFDYADKVLEGWYSEGVRTLSEAEKAIEKFKAEHEKSSAGGANSSGMTASSFDGDEFLKLAIKRSMGQ